MKKKFLRDISASSFQMVISHMAGLIIFYILSTQLDKNIFGEINWTLAVTLTIFNILSCGIDNVSIRKIASGAQTQPLISTYVWHVLFSGIIFYFFVFICQALFPAFFKQHNLILLLGLSRMLIFFTTPFKQLATGLGNFRLVMWMSISSHLIRALAFLVLAFLKDVTLNNVLIIFISSAIAELFICLLIADKKLNALRISAWNFRQHARLIKDSLPQLGVVIFDSAIARFDWIFLGLLTSTIVLADYSFAYKVFEVCTIPLLIVAPLLIPRFTRFFKADNTRLEAERLRDLYTLLRFEMIIALLITLVLNLTWVPLIDAITDGKYGSVNADTVLLLSASMPFLYLNNFFWTINFAQGHLKMVLLIITITFFVNIAGDLILIPIFKAEGAAIAYSLAIITQTALYFKKTNLAALQNAVYPLVVCSICAAASGLLSISIFSNIYYIVAGSIVCYIILLILARQLKAGDRLMAKAMLGK